MTRHIVKKLAVSKRDTTPAGIPWEHNPTPAILLQNPSPSPQLRRYFRRMLSQLAPFPIPMQPAV